MGARQHRRVMDLAVLRENVRSIRSALPEETRLMAVVKADGYGHGMIPVARNALAAGADALAVALADEGVQLREAGIESPVLVLGAASPEELAEGVRYGLTMTVCSPDMVLVLQKAAEALNQRALAHLKVDTGMNRIGVRTTEEVRKVMAALETSPGVQLTGAFTHFADADGEELDFTLEQLRRFKELTEPLPKGILRHCANSAAVHRFPEAAMDMVRAGISMYGYPPVPTDMQLRPFMRWTAPVTYVKTIEPGDTVSYGRTFTADERMRVATIACGYGDGYHRAASGKAEVILHGRRVPVIGRICMDQMMADVSGLPEVVPGDEAVLMGREGESVITAEDLAAWAGTISYEVLLAATGRVQRIWLNDLP